MIHDLLDRCCGTRLHRAARHPRIELATQVAATEALATKRDGELALGLSGSVYDGRGQSLVDGLLEREELIGSEITDLLDGAGPVPVLDLREPAAVDR